jgi:hypothetical protein
VIGWFITNSLVHLLETTSSSECLVFMITIETAPIMYHNDAELNLIRQSKLSILPDALSYEAVPPHISIQILKRGRIVLSTAASQIGSSTSIHMIYQYL